MRAIRMRLRFIRLFSYDRRRRLMRGRRPFARGQAGPKHVEGGLYPGVQCGVAIERPDEQRAENGLTEYMSNLRGGEIVANFAALLADSDDLAVQGVEPLLHIDHGLTNG